MAQLKPRVFIRQPAPGDAAVFLAAVRRGRTLHRGWVSPPSTTAARYLQAAGVITNDGPYSRRISGMLSKQDNYTAQHSRNQSAK